ncbi:hypothetical protein MJN54_31275, partial [Salmonella enterica subsp. enterica serovar Kentucky]|nr:hypothetical protein [Salmonella enterica subsp. enterica serovar Kentucky]
MTREFLQSQLTGEEREIFLVIFLDAQHRVLQHSRLFSGTLNHHLPLGNKTSRFTQSALALMIASTLPAYAGTFNPRFLEDVPGI